LILVLLKFKHQSHFFEKSICYGGRDKRNCFSANKFFFGKKLYICTPTFLQSSMNHEISEIVQNL